MQGVRDLAASQKRRISKSAKGLYPKSQLGKESMRTFNYYGQTRLDSLDENDVDGLKREIEDMIKNPWLGLSPVPPKHPGNTRIVNHDLGEQSLPKKRTKTAGGQGTGTRARKKSSLLGKKNLMSGQAEIMSSNMNTADQINYSKSQPNMQNKFMKFKGPGTGSLGPTRNDQQLGFNNKGAPNPIAV